ncbi:uncharacterized protein LOC113311925 [Papaver somniferum]|uniref:uncharacterized protein LOC113311925 n=1 Tax=Papaver somniferum TaxID=3469 RepID=UPI000E6FDE2E|nr:uncharacterized protein LOC113311925 [Papaver somniferum]
MIDFVEEMDELLDGLGCRLRVSGMVSDSIMMGIVNSAMEQAFQKACSKEGNIERLNEKSRFCVLAVVQLELCIKIFQEDTDIYVVVDNSLEREKLVLELGEIKDRIQRRLEETEFAISEKDRELNEALQALDRKDREVWSLRNNLNELGKVKSEGVQEFVRSNRVVVDDKSIDGDFCELKNSVDQQFLNIKQKLEDERINITSSMRKIETVNVESDSRLVEDEENSADGAKKCELYEKGSEIEISNRSLKPELNAGFCRMGSDIDVLKGTLDVAFGMMDNVISLSEVKPLEQKWRWTIEMDTIAVVINGYLRDTQDHFGGEVRGGQYCGSLVLKENWPEFLNDVITLRQELENLMDQVKNSKRRESISPPSQKDVGEKLFPFKRRESISPPSSKDVGDKFFPHTVNIKRRSVSDASVLDKFGNLVDEAKIFQRRESVSPSKDVGYTEFFQKTNQSRAKPSAEASAVVDRYGKPPNTTPLKIKTQEQEPQEEQFKEDSSGQGSSLVAEMIRNHETIIRQKNAESNWLKVEILREKGSSAKKDTEPDTLKQRIQHIIVKLDNIIEVSDKVDRGNDANGGCALTSMAKNKLANQEQEFSNLESMIRTEISSIILKGLVKDYVAEFYEYGIECLISEYVSKVYLSEMITERNEDSKRYYLERDIKEDICQLVLSSHLQSTILEKKENDLVNVSTLPGEETVKEWNEGLESYNIGRHIEEELYNIVFREWIKDMHGFTGVQCQTDRTVNNFLESSTTPNKSFQNLDGVIREEVCTAILRETFKEWKDALKRYNTESWISEDVSQIVYHDTMKDCIHSFSSTACCKSGSQDNVMEDIYVNRLSSLEGKIKEDAVLLKNVDMILKDLECYKYESLVEEEVYQIVMNEVVKDLKDVIKFTLNECQEAKDQGLVREDVCKVVLREMIKEWNKEIRIHNLERLREMKHHFKPDVELVSSLKKRESLYRKAFLRRCYDLQKAETEVDLLGDEVDALLSLLEKIYRSLEQMLPVSQHDFKIMEIINAIRKELYGPAACTS